MPSGGAPSFAKRVRDLGLEASLLAAIEPLLEMHSELCDKIRCADKYVAAHLKQDARAKQLESVPSIGLETAATFMAVIDDVTRFSSAKQLRCCLGLVPREYSSGERQLRGHITKAGNRRLRSPLVQCAWGIVRRAHAETDALRDWALRIAQRRGKRIAAVALARKLAGILFAMTRDSTTFAGNSNQQSQAVAA